MKTSILAGVVPLASRQRRRRLSLLALFCLLAAGAPAATWVPAHDETYTGTGWIPTWVAGHYETRHVDGYWEQRIVDGHYEDVWVPGHEESSWVDGYSTSTWTDGYYEQVWNDGYYETVWNDGYYQDVWNDGYYDADGNWNDGYWTSEWVDGSWSTNWVDGSWSSNWVDGHWETSWVEGHTETTWVDGYTSQVWVPPTTETVWVPGYDESVWVDGYWTITWGQWTVTVHIDGHWVGEWTWTSHDYYEDVYYADPNWSPDPSTVAFGQTFTQTRSGVRPHVHWETNEAGDIRNFTSGPDFVTDSRSAIGTRLTWIPFDDPGPWIGNAPWTPDAATVALGVAFTQTSSGSIRQHRTGERSPDGQERNVSTYSEGGGPNLTQSAVGTCATCEAKNSQTITFDPISSKAYGEFPFTLSATATSGLPVVFSIVSGPATISGNQVVRTDPGAITIRASQPGNASYSAAADVDRSFTVAPNALAASQMTPTQFAANWTSAFGATGYRLDVATDRGFTNLVIANLSVTGRAYLVNNVSLSLRSQTYYYRVRAETAVGTTQNSNVISAGPLGFAQSASPSAWIEVPTFKRDPQTGAWTPQYSGLRDEVIPVGPSGGFNYFIQSWNYYNPNRGVFFYPVDYPVNDWWNEYSAGLSDVNGNIQASTALEWIAAFTFYDDPQWFTFYVDAEFNALPDETYDIFFSQANVLTGEQLGRGTVNGGSGLWFPNGGWQLISLINPFNLAELNQGSFFLVRRAKPVDRVNVALPNGATLRANPTGSISVDLMGGLTASFASGGCVILPTTGSGPTVTTGSLGTVVSMPGVGSAPVSIGPGGMTVGLPTGGSVTVSSTGAISVSGLPGVPTVGNPVVVGGVAISVDGTGKVSASFPDGTVINASAAGGGIVFPNGNAITISKDGTVGGRLVLPGGTVVTGDTAGNASITLPGGLGVGVGPGGKIAISLPPGTIPPLLAQVIDIAGKVMRGEVIWVVREILGNGVFGPTTPYPATSGAPNIATASGGGRYEVGLRYGPGETQILWFAPRPQIKLLVDANRDGVIADNDTTSADTPFRFWINDDDDVDDNDPDHAENAPVSSADWLDDKIDGIRDLEDFARLKINLSGIADAVRQGQMRIALEWKGAPGYTGAPGIKLWRNLSPNGGTEYLSDVNVARQHLALREPGTIQGALRYVIPTQYWTDVGLSASQPYGNLLFEGTSAGKDQLVIKLLNADGAEIGEGGGVWLELKNIKSMYERVKATANGAEDLPFPYNYVGTNSVPSPTMGWSPDPAGYPFEPAQGETQTYIVAVHGWNQTYERSVMYAETMFKRLWHRGYKGRFVGFRWPTFTGLTSYNDSEYRAWKCGVSLKQYLSSLPDGYTVNLVAHSMGNIVVGSALEKGAAVANYALLNAAVPAICYDTSGTVVQTGWGYVTPNDDPDSATVALSYQGRLANVSGNLVNFFLPADSALSAWEINNDSPDGGRYPVAGARPHQWPEGSINAGYRYQRTAPAGQKLRLVRVDGERILSSADEAMGFAVQAPSLTVGADGRTRGAIDEWVDMSTYGFGSVHSAEFLFSIQQTREFYAALLLKLRVTTQP